MYWSYFFKHKVKQMCFWVYFPEEMSCFAPGTHCIQNPPYISSTNKFFQCVVQCWTVGVHLAFILDTTKTKKLLQIIPRKVL